MAHLADELKRNASLVAFRSECLRHPSRPRSNGPCGYSAPSKTPACSPPTPTLSRSLPTPAFLWLRSAGTRRAPLASGHDVEDAGITPLGRRGHSSHGRCTHDSGRLASERHCFDDVVRLTTRPFVREPLQQPRRMRTPAQPHRCSVCRDSRPRRPCGLNYCPAFLRDDSDVTEPTADDLCCHIEHWLDLGGEDVVALGSDFDGTGPSNVHLVGHQDARTAGGVRQALRRGHHAQALRRQRTRLLRTLGDDSAVYRCACMQKGRQLTASCRPFRFERRVPTPGARCAPDRPCRGAGPRAPWMEPSAFW